MGPMHTRLMRATLLATVIAGLTGVASARADFIAAYDTVSAAGGRDVAVVNLTTGAQVRLPAGINTPAPELHPSLSPDGRFLAFERVVPVQAGPDGPLVEQKQPFIFNLATGANVTPTDLSIPLTDPGDPTPTFSADGTQLATGRYSDGPFPDGNVRITELSNPPASAGQVAVTSGNPPLVLPPCDVGPICGEGFEEPKTYSPSVGAGPNPLVAWNEDYFATLRSDQFSSGATTFSNTVNQTGIVIRQFGPGFVPQGNAVTLLAGPGVLGPDSLLHPSVGLNNLVAYQAGGQIGMYDFATGQNFSTIGGVDTLLQQRLPAFTPDGRYLAFMRQGTDGHERLVLFDFGGTEQPVNAGGLDLGALPDPGQFGNLSVVEVTPPPTVFCALECIVLRVSPTALNPARLTAGTLIGLLVQRIVGTHKLFGHTVPTLVDVGRIPLGFHRHAFTVQTPLVVDGRELKDGKYLITARTLTAQGVIKDLSVSLAVRVHHGHLHKLTAY